MVRWCVDKRRSLKNSGVLLTDERAVDMVNELNERVVNGGETITMGILTSRTRNLYNNISWGKIGTPEDPWFHAGRVYPFVRIENGPNEETIASLHPAPNGNRATAATVQPAGKLVQVGQVAPQSVMPGPGIQPCCTLHLHLECNLLHLHQGYTLLGLLAVDSFNQVCQEQLLSL